MSFEVIATDRFERNIRRFRKKYASADDDYERLLDELESNPSLGEALGRDCFKVRMRIKSKNAGKSGGARVITCVKIIGQKVYLLTIYDKSEQATITDNERDELLKENGLL
ncbi:type II toxin-antitoxin system RelE/ParE family toxin [Hymenobacter convexus]|uniref:type II toxin-antitoxin system RelE/ParE family toxin n=1 Tax=Hymenobacter sp. CA1UV-4 TaxID=3063782 RepID=UPI00271301DB|nr:type II toxin-antitoxin system RelE/ParE family toxin [Hymenobacter sp. CA1UV-4]MDO7852372.1 type II toxin-antitoxin system RelE/ParE family toxin [Hymenobacter sp. CA1UV-4]